MTARAKRRGAYTGGVLFTHGGKYRNVPLAAIPLDYLKTAQGWELASDLLEAVDREVRRREGYRDPPTAPTGT